MIPVHASVTRFQISAKISYFWWEYKEREEFPRVKPGLWDCYPLTPSLSGCLFSTNCGPLPHLCAWDVLLLKCHLVITFPNFGTIWSTVMYRRVYAVPPSHGPNQVPAWTPPVSGTLLFSLVSLLSVIVLTMRECFLMLCPNLFFCNFHSFLLILSLEDNSYLQTKK